jgi:hypothetical protein
VTRFEQIAAAFPLHCQRIAEIAGRRWLDRVRSMIAWGNAGDELQCAFHWAATDEGHDYWRSLAQGVHRGCRRAPCRPETEHLC